MSTPIIDIHVHATMKPYGISLYDSANPNKVNDPSCIWYQDPPKGGDEVMENTLGLSRYRQGDFSSAVEGQVRILLTALYPVETGFVIPRQGFLDNEKTIQWIANFASLLGKEKIKDMMSPEYNYFQRLQDEYEYLRKHQGKPLGSDMSYQLVDPNLSLDQQKDGTNILIIPTIEGAHVFCEGNNVFDGNLWSNLVKNVSNVKKWPNPPFFITMGHHFYNGICTHAKSLFGLNAQLLNQEIGMRDEELTPNDTFPPLSANAHVLIDELLSTQNGRRILIDVKHMSKDARREYYSILQTKYAAEKIPVICSHGGIMIAPSGPIYEHQINMDVEDIKWIYQTEGLFGVEIDQRILGYEHQRFRKWLGNAFKSDDRQNYDWAEYFWNNVRGIAEIAYSNGYTQNPWKCICLGSDFDGLINPLNEYKTLVTVPTLFNCLSEHIENYWRQPNSIIPRPVNTDGHDIAYQIMYTNALEFIQTHYK